MPLPNPSPKCLYQLVHLILIRRTQQSALNPPASIKCNKMLDTPSKQNIKMSSVSNHNNDLTIPDGVTFVGTINVPGFAQINGDISGEITCKELEVGPQGNIKGKVNAQAIQVHGQLENDINCKGLVKIHKTGKVSGKLVYAEIDIDRGGQFIGAMSGTK